MKELLIQKDTGVAGDLVKIAEGTYWDPHHVLGLHPAADGKKVIRLFRPGAEEIYLELFGKIVPTKKIHELGFFEVEAPSHTTEQDYRIYHQNGLLAHDPYAFWPTFGEMEGYLFSRGVDYLLYEHLGAHLITHQGVKGVKFAVWAPSAERVSVVGDFNFWNGKSNPMRSLGYTGVWELFIPAIKEGERYKFEVKTKSGALTIKADPMANAAEIRPQTASVVADLDRYQWKDYDWMEMRAKKDWQRAPFNIYEVHLGSWKRAHGWYLNYGQLAHELAEYCKEMGYTHVELLPIEEHPYDESWGYQVTGFFAPTSRHGKPADFQYFVDYLHQNGIGVILDWVPGHFPKDDFALAQFDGTALYEHADPKQGIHPHWNTYIFNYGRVEVSNFLIASALFWLSKMHIDGLRVDAVASMLYLDYGREEGEWIPNMYGGKENIEAIEFLRHLNSVVHQKHKGALMIAEESTSFCGVTKPVEHQGLGFDLKWNMGWMNDTLRYFHKEPIFRRYHHNDLTFGLLYAFSERFLSVLSHDEVVHGKGSLISKMPGDLWQKFANLRSLLSYLICQPGKKMLFMGGEIGQFDEWWSQEEIHWHLLQYPHHSGLQLMVKELNHLYLTHPQLWERDFDYNGFEWVDFADLDNSVISYRRKASVPSELLCVHHLNCNLHDKYFLALPRVKEIREIFNSDHEKYGGANNESQVKIIKDEAGMAIGIQFVLPPLATIIFDVRYF